MRIRDWMKHPVHTIRPLDSIEHARALLEEHRINQLPVVVKTNVVGIITDRDLRDAFPSVFEVPDFGAEGARKSGRDPKKVRVEEVMTRQVLTLAPDQLLRDAARMMRSERVGAVPVVENGHLVGIVTRSDILEAFAASAGEPETAPEGSFGQGGEHRQRR